ncbi:uncharacterized protein [Anas platyrhynchos]
MGAPSRGVLGAVVLWCRAPGRGRPVFPRVGPCAPGGAGCRWLRARLPAGRSSSPALGPLRGLLPSEGGTAGKLRKAAAGVLQSQVVQQQVNLRRNWSKETVLSGTVKFLFGNSVTSLIYFSGVEIRTKTFGYCLIGFRCPGSNWTKTAETLVNTVRLDSGRRRLIR